jgi:hypothetical protein
MMLMKAARNELARTLSQSHKSENMPYKGSTILSRMQGPDVILSIVSFGNGPNDRFIWLKK